MWPLSTSSEVISLKVMHHRSVFVYQEALHTRQFNNATYLVSHGTYHSLEEMEVKGISLTCEGLETEEWPCGQPVIESTINTLNGYILHSHQHYEVSNFSKILPAFVIVYLILDILVSGKWHFVMVLNVFSTDNCVQHDFMCPLSIYISSLEKGLLESLAHF